MLTKTIKPIFRDATKGAKQKDGTKKDPQLETVGTLVTFRLFGLMIYKKQFFTPKYYGVKPDFGMVYPI